MVDKATLNRCRGCGSAFCFGCGVDEAPSAAIRRHVGEEEFKTAQEWARGARFFDQPVEAFDRDALIYLAYWISRNGRFLPLDES